MTPRKDTEETSSPPSSPPLQHLTLHVGTQKLHLTVETSIFTRFWQVVTALLSLDRRPCKELCASRRHAKTHGRCKGHVLSIETPPNSRYPRHFSTMPYKALLSHLVMTFPPELLRSLMPFLSSDTVLTLLSYHVVTMSPPPPHRGHVLKFHS